jgi:predicted  nucleic acid-binding Zn-ribbon protein
LRIPLVIQAFRLYNRTMSQSSNLYRLQQIDTLLDQAAARLEEIEKLLSDRSALILVEENYKASQEALQTESKKLTQAENEVRDQRIKIEQDESSLYSGKMHNPKELQDLQNEVISLKRFLVVLEDRQIEKMISMEEAEAAAQSAKVDFENAQAKMIEQQAQLNGQKSSFLRDKERLDIERQAACEALASKELDLYNQLRKQKKGIAVTKIVDRTCTSCGATLTPAVVQAANAPNQIVRCTSCSRILYPG